MQSSMSERWSTQKKLIKARFPEAPIHTDRGRL